jgi:hypothetical protein
MRLLRRLLRTQAGRTLFVVLVCYGAYTLWAMYQAEGKIHDDVPALVDERGRVDVEVELAFSPERFHILVIQDHGRIRRTLGDVVHVRAELDDLRRLARRHWIVEIRPAEDPLALAAPARPSGAQRSATEASEVALR